MVPRLASILFVAILSLLFARQARADGPKVPIAVLSVESDDAEDQAEALTVALRSRLRAGASFQVVDVSQSLGMLTGALKCGKVPDAACQGKIADQLRVERVIWGTMQKSANHQVTADLHLFHKGKGETPVRESYSDNLKDGNDDALRRVAQRILDRLMQKTPGFATIKGNAGEVLIDGGNRTTIEKGSLRLDLPPGPHTLEFSGKGLKGQKREVTIAPGVEVAVNITLAAEAAVAGPVKVEPEPVEGGGGNTRKIIGYAVMGVGGAGVLTGGMFGVVYLDKRGKQSDLNAKFPSNAGDACEYAAGNTALGGASKGAAKEACDNSRAGEKAGNTGLIIAGAGAVVLGVGAYFAFTGSDSQDKEKPKRLGVHVSPTFGRDSGGVLVLGQF